MDGLPVTIRLLDPPLHEFLPDGELQRLELGLLQLLRVLPVLPVWWMLTMWIAPMCCLAQRCRCMPERHQHSQLLCA